MWGVWETEPEEEPADSGPSNVGGGQTRLLKRLTCRQGDKECPTHEQDVQNHQPGVASRQIFLGTHPHPCVLRPVGGRGRWIQLEVFLLIPFGLDLSVVRVSVIMLGRNRENETKESEQSIRKGRGASHSTNPKGDER